MESGKTTDGKNGQPLKAFYIGAEGSLLGAEGSLLGAEGSLLRLYCPANSR